jgi:hypothetical protein
VSAGREQKRGGKKQQRETNPIYFHVLWTQILAFLVVQQENSVGCATRDAAGLMVRVNAKASLSPLPSRW